MAASAHVSSSVSDEAPVASVQKIQGFLKAKDDTSRFVGLALLKSVLDNSPELQKDEESIVLLWACISPKFLDRLLKTGSGQNEKRIEAREMRNLAVSVLHTFMLLIPNQADPKLLGRISNLVASLLHSSDETIKLTLEILLTLVNSQDGAKRFAEVEDTSPLTEIAPSHPLALEVFSFAWLNSMADLALKPVLARNVDATVTNLVASFTGTDAVTLLSFLAQILPRLDPEVLPQDPRWLKPLIKFVRHLAFSRPTAAGRDAYTNLAAVLLRLYPSTAPDTLFSNDGAAAEAEEKPFSYLLINLLLIDLRSSLHVLLEQLNTPEYVATSHRLASAFDLVSAFTGHLLRSLEPAPPTSASAPTSAPPLVMPPDLLLKLRTAIAETMSVAVEYLRDRYDASVAGAQGLHPTARATSSDANAGPASITWDDKSTPLAADPLTLAALRALALWLREDDNAALRAEAAGLGDLLADLYRGSSSSDGNSGGAPHLDFRPAVLVALEGLAAADQGDEQDDWDGGADAGSAVSAFLAHDGWAALAADLAAVLEGSSAGAGAGAGAGRPDACRRGIEVVRVLLAMVEGEAGRDGSESGTREGWLDLVTRVAGWAGPLDKEDEAVEQAAAVRELQVAALQLVTALLVGAAPGLRARYRHSAAAVMGVAARLEARVQRDPELVEALQDVLTTLDGFR